MAINRKKFLLLLNKTRDKSVNAIVAGSPTGSMFQIDIGKQILREKEINNPHLSQDYRKYEGEFSLFIEYCVWRLEFKKTILTGWNEPTGNPDPLALELEKLAGDTIKKIQLSKFYDLKITFGSGKILNVFCDIFSRNEVNLVKIGISGIRKLIIPLLKTIL